MATVEAGSVQTGHSLVGGVLHMATLGSSR